MAKKLFIVICYLFALSSCKNSTQNSLLKTSAMATSPTQTPALSSTPVKASVGQISSPSTSPAVGITPFSFEGFWTFTKLNGHEADSNGCLNIEVHQPSNSPNSLIPVVTKSIKANYYFGLSGTVGAVGLQNQTSYFSEPDCFSIRNGALWPHENAISNRNILILTSSSISYAGSYLTDLPDGFKSFNVSGSTLNSIVDDNKSSLLVAISPDQKMISMPNNNGTCYKGIGLVTGPKSWQEILDYIAKTPACATAEGGYVAQWINDPFNVEQATILKKSN